jgi:hypothetical protein
MRSASRLLAKFGALAVATGAAFAASVSTSAATPPVSTIHGFLNYQLGASLANETCPNSTTSCQNFAAEPAIRADKLGNFYGVSENGLSSGTEAWKSVDGGLHYTHLTSPNIVSSPANGTPTGVSPAGGDTDIATASVPNTNGFYNVYVSSLGGANTDVSTSKDGGQTWTQNLLSGKFPGQDREWIAADGQSKVCISYISAAVIVLVPLGLHVECSYNAGTTFTQVSDAINPLNLGSRFGLKIGNLMIDQNSNTGDPMRNNDIVYQTFSSQTVNDQADPNPTANHIVWMAVSRDGGRTFNNYQVYNNPVVTTDYGHQFVNVSVDRAGNVYSFFSDNHNLFFMFSTDHGQTWRGKADGTPILVNAPPSNTAIFPWSAAGDAGKVDVVWYGTSVYQPGGTESYPYPTTQWYVYFGQNLQATTVGSTFSQVQATPIVHLGGVCQGGVGCLGTLESNRDLYDDFGVAVRPTTGLASIIYSDDQSDQYTKGCTGNNTGSCDHTSIATQTTGTPIISGGGGGGCHEVHGGGDIKGKSGGTAHFQSDESCPPGSQDGEREQDPGANEDFHSTSVQSTQFDAGAGTMTIIGVGTSNGLPVTFTIVEQAATAATPALYTIQLSDGYFNAGPLLSGTISLR